MSGSMSDSSSPHPPSPIIFESSTQGERDIRPTSSPMDAIRGIGALSGILPIMNTMISTMISPTGGSVVVETEEKGLELTADIREEIKEELEELYNQKREEEGRVLKEEEEETKRIEENKIIIEEEKKRIQEEENE
jgi:hypothetical protein